jgi:hypothetical protein
MLQELLNILLDMEAQQGLVCLGPEVLHDHWGTLQVESVLLEILTRFRPLMVFQELEELPKHKLQGFLPLTHQDTFPKLELEREIEPGLPWEFEQEKDLQRLDKV